MRTALPWGKSSYTLQTPSFIVLAIYDMAIHDMVHCSAGNDQHDL